MPPKSGERERLMVRGGMSFGIPIGALAFDLVGWVGIGLIAAFVFAFALIAYGIAVWTEAGRG